MTGTPIKNADPHQKRSSRSPPATGPMAAPVEKLVAQTPIANVRSLASENKLRIRDKVDGASVAPAIPWRPRAMIHGIEHARESDYPKADPFAAAGFAHRSELF